jgi:Fic family protein
MPEHEVTRIPWKPIAPLTADDLASNGSLAALDALREEWQLRLDKLSEHDKTRIRQRSLRRLAVETGILERLYDIDWGLTLTLVAEGLTRDVVERAGGQVDERTLATIRAQFDTLWMVLDFVGDERQLSVSFIKELHQAIVRTQDTYIATDTLGRIVETTLPKGIWKTQANHVLRQDNTLLEYAPPEQVASEMDRLIDLWTELEATAAHPIIKAAWLHHRFVQIHPFADGNGRVARALTLLVMERHRYAPLVVDRWHRDTYLQALDAANAGSLSELTRLFVKLEGAALTSELDRPPDVEQRGLAVDVAHTLAAQLAKARQISNEKLQRELRTRSVAVIGRTDRWFGQKEIELAEVFREQGLSEVVVTANTEKPPSEKAHWFRGQIIDSAHAAGHYADFHVYRAWSSLRVRLDRWQLRFVASLHGAGREPGVMAVTTFAEIQPVERFDVADERGEAFDRIRTTTDAFRFVHSESVDQISARASELENLLDEGLAVALSELLKRV